ncbi:hypothetical protein [Microbispora sp. GKU 823]|uniref:hypothetical protein n=1 Tax=Microbispora sp. GKU 823 TaxID=1652100 RepID=UPI0009A387FE|nr:hypothetical protein [Microbispora sp. GKU 823]OPG11457.1 hypothetical protein B1L11_20115 [Microbispora sp. GKU 823]
MSGRDLPGEQAGGQDGVVRVVLRPMGSPLPLGFLGLALAMTAFAAMELGWVPAAGPGRPARPDEGTGAEAGVREQL